MSPPVPLELSVASLLAPFKYIVTPLSGAPLYVITQCCHPVVLTLVTTCLLNASALVLCISTYTSSPVK